ncbi:hypothetical protein GUITHDRAFT_152560 [Guillardia theta CCMP2712]|uniref:Uncharacterized protein n=1 Tax=Guillardia theta (strain CCMP2712) TaxID=905079 RepID=L1JBU6_GUITC|nr:hypothetical protein GUITHDRAFT_152559 [Guillardia theta CCMP2712]XP_005832743.1 hypothetical protein GUITHDRAFT_152560 [Guillardia theta CCMP2712]EKX45762.1 hypothetical protein GUITHDRAFT_152559 [Guillardia theta CCMP2712]EKX45763.1 hypothetical protein GUITHDRAFT_152560 [Guillardia theta CCMP2712]|eukprot:XP_005832742.1 hypothetical protein GUITHDRAFT_152559 [Guillardia theta CCMP2712]
MVACRRIRSTAAAKLCSCLCRLGHPYLLERRDWSSIQGSPWTGRLGEAEAGSQWVLLSTIVGLGQKFGPEKRMEDREQEKDREQHNMTRSSTVYDTKLDCI